MVGTKTPNAPSSTQRKKWVIPVSILAVIALAAAGGLFWFFSGEAPSEVDLAATASSVAGNTESEEAAEMPAGIDGTWTVDTTIGEFTLDETTTSTFIGFRVEEVLNSIGSTTAVGRTPGVTGTITIDGTTLTSAEISADLTSIVSDESRREDSIQRALNTTSNPNATFVLTEPLELGAEAAEGEAITVVATGHLTVNGISQTVDVELDAQLIDGLILVTGTTDISFADYDVTAPTSPAVLSVEETGTVEIQLWLSS